MRQLAVRCTPGDTAIRILAADGTSYTTLTALQTAGKQPFPALDPGMNLGKVSVRTIDSSDESTSSDFDYQINTAKPSSINNMVHVSGGGQERQTGSTKANVNEGVMLWNVWFALSAAGDTLECVLEY